jgi:hypothetical protein
MYSNEFGFARILPRPFELQGLIRGQKAVDNRDHGPRSIHGRPDSAAARNDTIVLLDAACRIHSEADVRARSPLG